MAEGDGIVYNQIKESMAKGLINLETDIVKVGLFSASYTPDIDTDTGYATLTNECVNGLGYTTGGETVSSQSVSRDNANDQVLFDCADITWASLGTLSPQPAWAVMYDDTAAGKELIAAWEVVKPTNGGDYTLAISTSPAAAIVIG